VKSGSDTLYEGMRWSDDDHRPYIDTTSIRRPTMNRRPLLLLAVPLLLSAAPAPAASRAAPACDAVHWRTYQGTRFFRFPGSTAYFYVVSRMAVDADGAPNAYHPDNTGLDHNANAGYPGGGWKNVLVPDPSNPNRPYVQKEGEFKGYFVSMTALRGSLASTDVRNYPDARTVPYLVFPHSFYQLSGTGLIGDFGAARALSGGEESAAIVADVGPANAPLGEVSIGMAENLGGTNVNPRNGAGMPTGRFVYVVFPRSRANPRWPVGAADLEQRSAQLLAELGGWERILACVDAG
jgi:Fungal chitosanase of glycosyl hydrolase group 75